MYDIFCFGCGSPLTVLENRPVLCRECQEREAASLEAKITKLHAPQLLVDERRFDDVTLDQRDPGDEDDVRFI